MLIRKISAIGTIALGLGLAACATNDNGSNASAEIESAIEVTDGDVSQTQLAEVHSDLQKGDQANPSKQATDEPQGDFKGSDSDSLSNDHSLGHEEVMEDLGPPEPSESLPSEPQDDGLDPL